jgi:MFS family permease
VLLAVSQGSSWGWGDPRVIGLLALGVIILVVWARFELHVPQPLVDMQMMRLRGVWTTNVTALMVGFGMFGSFLLVPQLVEMPPSAGFGFGSSVTQAGLFLLPSAAVMLVAGPISGWMGNRYGSRTPLLLGIAVTFAAFVQLALLHDAHWHVYLSSTLMGIGIGLAFAAMATLIVDAVPQSQTGVATGMNTIMRSIGGALGAQILASIVGAHADESHFVAAFLVSAGGLVVAFVAGLCIPRPPSRDRGTVPHGARRLGEPMATASGS